MTDPCERCRSRFPRAVCQQICRAYKMAELRKTEIGLDTALFRRLKRISPKK